MSGNQNSPNASDDEAFVILIFSLITIAVFVWWIGRQGPFFNVVTGATASVFLYPWYIAVEHWPSLQSMPVVGFWLFDRPHDIVDVLSEGGYVLMNSQQRIYVASTLGYMSALYFGPFLLYLTWIGPQVRGDLKYVGQLGMEEMIRHHAKFWRTTRFLVNFSPKDDRNFEIKAANRALGQQKKIFVSGEISGMLHAAPKSAPIPNWARSIRPEEWLVTQGCTFDFKEWQRLEQQDLTEPTQYEYRSGWTSKTLHDYDEIFGLAFKEPWQGVDALPQILQAIFAVSVFFYDFQQEKGQKILDALGLIAAKTNCDARKIDASIQHDPGLSGLIKEAKSLQAARILTSYADQHAWVITAIQRFVEEGKKGRGILASAQFNWLKGVDRRLWYVFSSLGGDVASIESAAAAAHYKAEKQFGVPLQLPMVRQVSRSLLEDYLDMTKIRQELKHKKKIRLMTPVEKIALRVEQRKEV